MLQKSSQFIFNSIKAVNKSQQNKNYTIKKVLIKQLFELFQKNVFMLSG